MRLAGRSAIVTGAGSGIGRAVAVGFAAEGARVAVADIDEARVAETVAAITDAGGDAFGVRVDVSDRASIDSMMGDVLARFETIDAVLSNAGISRPAPFLEMTEADWDVVLDTNLKGQFLVGQAVARHMAQHSGGSIINTSSQLAEGAANPRSANYLASKGGCRMLTKAMAVDLAEFGIRVNALAPGPTVTNLSQHGRYQNTDADAARRAMMLARIPMGRMGQPEDMVGACVFLASDDSRFVTGATLIVDGGYTAR